MHPYREMSADKFWKRAVSTDFSAAALWNGGDEPLIEKGRTVVSAGSCFAAELVPYLERHGFTYLRTEYTHSFYRHVPAENFSYGKFSAGYGNIYTARQLLQLLLRSQGKFRPAEDRWREGGFVIDPFRPGLRYPAGSDAEFDALTARHLAAVGKAFQTCDVLIFTLGLTEAWVSRIDGAVYPACPGTIAGSFDDARHAFHNFGVDEIVADLNAFIALLRETNPRVRLILTVSPVPLVATATKEHVLVATTYSKSVLRVAAAEVVRSNTNVFYFPSYEIVTGPQAPDSFFQADRRNVTREAVDTVMTAFLSACKIAPEAGTTATDVEQPAPMPRATDAPTDVAAALSARVVGIECEEAAVDP